jgi:hypothetical protein
VNRKRILKVRKNLLPSPKKIMTRGMYEIMWGSKQRSYEINK